MSAKKGLVGSTALALFLALCMGGVTSASPLPLPGPSQPSIRPLSPAPVKGYWQLQVRPGERVPLRAEVRNVGQVRATFRVLATGAGTSSGTGVGYPAGGPTASWLHTTTTRVSVVPGAGVLVHATLTVPENAKPGQYVGGLEALGAAGKPSAKGRVEIAQRDASVVAWVVTVGQPHVDRITWGRPSVSAAAGPEIQFPARNTGQLLWGPKVNLALRTGSCGQPGKLLMAVTRQWAMTVPGTSWAYPVPLSAALPPGRYCASERAGAGQPARQTLEVTPAQHHHEVSSPGAAHVHTAVVSTTPVVLVAALGGLIAALLAAIIVLLVKSRRRM